MSDTRHARPKKRTKTEWIGGQFGPPIVVRVLVEVEGWAMVRRLSLPDDPFCVRTSELR